MQLIAMQENGDMIIKNVDEECTWMTLTKTFFDICVGLGYNFGGLGPEEIAEGVEEMIMTPIYEKNHICR